MRRLFSPLISLVIAFVTLSPAIASEEFNPDATNMPDFVSKKTEEGKKGQIRSNSSEQIRESLLLELDREPSEKELNIFFDGLELEMIDSELGFALVEKSNGLEFTQEEKTQVESLGMVSSAQWNSQVKSSQGEISETVDTQSRSLLTADPYSWALDALDQDETLLDYNYEYSLTGEGVTVYIVDSGINVNHQEFDRVSSGYSSHPEAEDVDCSGHGTHVAGSAVGQNVGPATNATLVSVKVFGGSDCEAKANDLVSGLQWIRNNASGPSVVNMSLGADNINSFVDSAVQATIDDGIIVVAASGNDGANACNYSPGRVSDAITVNAYGLYEDGSGGYYEDDALFSNFGSCTDIYAPGVLITSADYSGNSGYVNENGTSMAAPLVAGVAAMMLEADPTATPAEVWNKISTMAKSSNYYISSDAKKTISFDHVRSAANPALPIFANGSFDTTKGEASVNWNPSVNPSIYSNEFFEARLYDSVEDGVLMSNCYADFTEESCDMWGAPSVVDDYTLLVDSPRTVQPGSTLSFDVTVLDPQGNRLEVDGTDFELQFQYDGPGDSPGAGQSISTDENGEASASVFLGSNDSGLGIGRFTLREDPQGTDGLVASSGSQSAIGLQAPPTTSIGNFGSGEDLHLEIVSHLSNGDVVTKDYRLGVSNYASPPTGDWVSVEAGDLGTFCAINDSGEVYCWGYNGYAVAGQPGAPVANTVFYPQKVSGFDNPVTEVSMESTYACALTDAGDVFCWGTNKLGVLGVPTSEMARNHIAQKISISNATDIGVGERACAVSAGELYCWGPNPENTESTSPSVFDTNVTPIDFESSGDHSCFTHASGVRCWGYGFFGSIGNGTSDNQNVPTEIDATLTNPTGLELHGLSSCVDSDEGIHCWGENREGMFGVGDSNVKYSPVRIADSDPFAVGYENTCVSDDGDLTCAGDNRYSMLASGQNFSELQSSSTFVDANAPSSVIDVALEGDTGCLITSEGALACWGDGNNTGIGKVDLDGDLEIFSTEGEVAQTTPRFLLPDRAPVVDQPSSTVVVVDGELTTSVNPNSPTSAVEYQYWLPEDTENKTVSNATVDGYGFRNATAQVSMISAQTYRATASATNDIGSSALRSFDVFVADVPQVSNLSSAGTNENSLDFTFDISPNGLQPELQVFVSESSNFSSSDVYNMSFSGDLFQSSQREEFTINNLSRDTEYFVKIEITTDAGSTESNVVSADTDSSSSSSGGSTGGGASAGGGGGGGGGAAGSAPVVESSPVIAGSHQIGSTLDASLGQWDSQDYEYTYQWHRCDEELVSPTQLQVLIDCDSISGATSKTYEVSEADVDKHLIASVSASDGFYSTVTFSDSIAPGETIEGDFSSEETVDEPVGEAATETGYWTKRNGDNVKLYAKNIIGLGKVQFFMNDEEIAWIRAEDKTDPKLRVITEGPMTGASYLVRDRDLPLGKNVFEIYVDGERVERRVASR